MPVPVKHYRIEMWVVRKLELTCKIKNYNIFIALSCISLAGLHNLIYSAVLLLKQATSDELEKNTKALPWTILEPQEDGRY